MTLIEEMEKELATISETARRIMHKRYGVDLAHKQLTRIKNLLSRYNAQKANLITVQRDRLEKHVKANILFSDNHRCIYPEGMFEKKPISERVNSVIEYFAESEE